jgi:hypothetical protein
MSTIPLVVAKNEKKKLLSSLGGILFMYTACSLNSVHALSNFDVTSAPFLGREDGWKRP